MRQPLWLSFLVQTSTRKGVIIMGGRKRKVVDMSTGKIGKQERINRKTQEEKLKVSENLSPPDWLDDFAKEEFMRVVEASRKIELLDDLDLSILAIYSDAFSKYRETVQILNDCEIPINRFVSESGKVNPIVNAQDKYIKTIMQCSSKLGLAVTDRLKLIVPTPDEKPINPFMKYI